MTGGAGFIGSHIAEALVGLGHRVRILDDFSTGSMKNLAGFEDKLEIVKGSIIDGDAVEQSVQDVNFIFHEAALVSVPESIKEPRKTFSINIEGTRMILEAARKCSCRKVVLASSAAVYGPSPPPLGEDAPTKTLSPYGESKLQAERLMKEYNSSGLPVVSLRYFNVYGPRQNSSSPYSGVIAKFTDCFLDARAPVIFGDGKQTRDFIYVKDVVRANLLAMEKEKADGEAINIATGKPTSLNELVEIFGKITGSDIRPIYREGRAGDITHSYANISKANRLLEFKATYFLEKGLGETLEWRKTSMAYS